LRLYEAGPPGVKHFVIKILQLQRTVENIALFEPLSDVENPPVTRLAVEDLSGWSKNSRWGPTLSRTAAATRQPEEPTIFQQLDTLLPNTRHG
jgi:hypothetical protein